MNKQLEIKNWNVTVDGKPIVRDVSFSVKPAGVTVFMGPNGSGKSTLVTSMMGSAVYRLAKNSRLVLDGKNLNAMDTENRVRSGLFLSFQNPVSVPGVSVLDIIRTGYMSIHADRKKDHQGEKIHNPALTPASGGLKLLDLMKTISGYAQKLGVSEGLLSRAIGDGFSGGEKKKIEMLTALIFAPKYVLFDEIDTGLDVDALKSVAKALNILKSKQTGLVIITHTRRILSYISPDTVHVLIDGRIVKTGDASLALQIDKSGYKKYSANL